ncbi:MAG: hypothetical protein IT342_01340 [Candidatus Melainabacteria bacterium]|nr:hypothetical protein [Candidatus Melainabacteria bacterium]
MNGPYPIFLGGLVPFAQHADALSLFFLFILSLVGLSIALFSPSYLEHFKEHFHPGIYWFSLFVFVASMAQVFLCADAISFIIFWELMSLSSAALVITNRASHTAKKATIIYLGATRVSTTLMFCGFLWLHALTNSWSFADWSTMRGAGLLPLSIIFAGFCIKAGTWPFHLWLPYAHTEAPAPISALMSGVMVKVAIYGMIRLILMSNTASVSLALVAIALGAISAFWGILFTQVEGDIKRLLAYSTVENIGLIVLSIGLVLLGKSTNVVAISSIGLAGCLFHVLNHGLYKPLLFLSAGAVDWGAHSRDLAKLGGLQRLMPWTAASFFFGSLAICSLPPLNGFASKWLIYQGLFSLSVGSNSISDRTMAIALIALLSMIGAMSVASFTKVFGLCFLGTPRTPQASHAKEMPLAALISQHILIACCLVLTFGAGLIVDGFKPIAQGVLPKYDVPAMLPQPQLVVALAIPLILFYFVLIIRGRSNVKYFSTWECGYGKLPLRSFIDAASFTRPLASLFGLVIQYRTENQIQGRDRRHFPDTIDVKAHQVLWVEKFFYSPILNAFDALGKGLIKLQTGSIHIHLFYVFATLILLVLIGTQP